MLDSIQECIWVALTLIDALSMVFILVILPRTCFNVSCRLWLLHSDFDNKYRIVVVIDLQV
jgi:hypothetical protein